MTMQTTFDESEARRRQLLDEQRVEGPLTREQLTVRYLTEVYDTGELQTLFSVHSFLAPYVSVTRKADGKRGSLEFQHAPRYYFNFVPIED